MAAKHFSLASCAVSGVMATHFYETQLDEEAIWLSGRSIREVRIRKLLNRLQRSIILMVRHTEHDSVDLYVSEAASASEVRHTLVEARAMWPMVNFERLSMHHAHLHLRDFSALPNECKEFLRRLETRLNAQSSH